MPATEFMTPDELLARFVDWQPKAVGVSGSVGCVCLSTLGELEDFVSQIDGRKEVKHGQADGTWKVEYMVDPEVVPAADARAFREAQVAAQNACREDKRVGRLTRREQVEGEDDVVDFIGCLGLE